MINSLISYTGLLLGAISLLFIQPHFLTKEEIGLTRVLFSFSSLMATFMPLGMNVITLKFFPHFRNYEKGHHGFFGLMLILPIIGFVVFGSLLFILKSFFIAKYIDQSKLFTDYFYYVFPLSFFLSFINVFIAYTYSIYRTSFPALINDVLVRVVSIVLFTVYFIKWISITQFIILFVGIYGIQFITLVVYIYWRDNPKLSIDRVFLRSQNVPEMLTYGFSMSIAAVSSLGLKYIDAVMLGMYKPIQNGLNALDIIGIYSIAAFIATIVEAPFNALEKIILPQIANSIAKNDMKNVEDIYYKSAKYLFLIGGVLFLLVNLNLSSLFLLMPDKDYSLGKNIVFIISLGTLINMATGSNDAIIYTSSKYKFTTYLLVGLFIVAVINYLIFIPYFGMVGAALATTLSAFLFNLSKYLLIWKFFKIQPFTWNTLKVAGVILFTFFACSLIPEVFHPIANIIIRSTAVLTCFIGLVFTLNIVPELFEQVKAKLK
ncbi:MAG: polysaccharide biosynthesis C-terminal domain-containing protein [Chitinophagales bacterium]|nr:polysaccharide biosynthesis C-terminal domain-containing protein [Chitinophagales bacterium]